MRAYTLGEIAKFIEAEIIGDADVKINSIATATVAQNGQLTYIVAPKYKKNLIHSRASAVILNRNLLNSCPTNALIVDDVYLAFAKLSHYFKPPTPQLTGIHPNAKINHAKLGQGCLIGKNVVLGKHCVIGANCVIEDGVKIGNNAYLYANVTILQNCVIGNNVVISPGAVIGAQGFGNAKDRHSRWHTIAHLGNVVIGDDVSIGANTTIDRGTLEDTQIHNGVRLDNLVHVAHNVVIGQDCAIAANTGIAGSTTLGKRCMIGGMVGIVGHLNICNDSVVNAKSTVDKDIKTPGIYTGIMPLMQHKQWQNIGIWLVKLDKIVKHLNIKLKNLKGY